MAMDAAQPFEFLGPAPCGETALASLPESMRCWFLQRFGAPTPAQSLSWPALTAGKNLLLTAPTGSGKTLAAFLPILGELLEHPSRSSLRCLYIAPLKALINDARRNLKTCLRELAPADCPCPVSIGRRTGDTGPRVRRRLRVQPPDILLTTPESLALLLSQHFAAELFAGLRWVIIDEVHALATNKRGADLSLSLERLETLARQPLQRIGLSATCAPVNVAAAFLAGVGRACSIATVTDSATLELQIHPLPNCGRGFLRTLLDRLEPELFRNRTTLIFTNVRSLAERLTWALRRRLPDWVEQIAVHHSSLSAVRRRIVERQLKQGRLRVVVSSTSLELGIDIGSVDGVVLVHPPGGVVRLLQRVGRAGHAPNLPRRGRVFTASTAELLETAVTGASSLSAQFEPLVVPEYPLDILCQQLLGMAAQRSWSTVAAFEVVRRAYPYRNLSWTDFADCVDYLSGTKKGVGSHFSRHHDGEKNDSRPLFLERLHWHEGEFSIADDRTARLLRRNIGSILTEPTRPVRMAEGEWLLAEGRLIGHVEEAFADRLQPGDRFLLDGRCLEFRRIEKRALLVEEAMGQPATPRWQGNGWPLSADLARRLFLMRSQASEALREGSAALDELLRQDYGLEPEAAEILATLFERQESVSEVPDALTVLVEVVSSDLGTDYYVHTSLNRAGNDAVARVAVLRLARNRGRTATSMVADLGFLLCPGGSGELTASDFSQLLLATGFDRDLDEAIAKSVTLRERFRCTATTGLMLLRNPLGKRRRVGGHEWAERRLFDKINALDPDFVLLRQARREIAAEVLDAAVARRFLEELPLRTLRCRRLPDVSPLAEGWTQAGAGPAEVVDSPAEALEKLHAMLMTQ